MPRKSLTGFDANNKQITSVADPSAATDAATKQYVDAVAAGRDWKESVRVATTANLSLTSPGATINGVTMAANDRVLVKNQTTASENGIYVWNGAAVAMTRANDADTSAKLTAGATVAVNEGTVDGDTRWTLTTNDAIVLGTTALTFSKDAGGGNTYIAGSGLAESPAGTFNIGAGNGIQVTADNINVDPAVVTRKFSADCAATTNPQTFTHNLNTLDVQVTIREASGGAHVEADVTSATVNTISVNFGGSPTAAQYRVTVMG